MSFFVRQFITGSNRPRVKIKPTTVTIHNTADPGATARQVARYFGTHPEAKASCHWIVDAKEAVNIIPETEESWHAGTHQGNMTSISVEVCEPKANGIKSTEWPAIYRNAVIITTDILLRHKWSIKNIRQHHDWSGKNCPRLLRPIWPKFLADVQKELNKHLRAPIEQPQDISE